MVESEQLMRNLTRIRAGKITYYVSYKTVVAFETRDDGLIVSRNVWSNTTGKHLNHIDSGNKKDRLPREEFKRRLAIAEGKIIDMPSQNEPVDNVRSLRIREGGAYV